MNNILATGRSVALSVVAFVGCMAFAAAPAQATDVGVSIGISQPGVYGRIDIGRFPQPAVVVAQPLIVHRPQVVLAQPEPVYMWVPPGHRKNWRKHCARYGACGAPVMFVQDRWYHEHVGARAAPPPPPPARHSGRYERGDDRGHGRGRDHDRGPDRRNDRRHD